MKSQKETTGLSSTEHKTQIVLNYLINWFEDHKFHDTEDLIRMNGDDKRLRLLRNDLSIFIAGELGVVNAETVRTWIKMLLGKGYIIQNPSSNRTPVQDKILPTNDTKYIVNIYKCKEAYDDLREKHNEFVLKNAQKKSVGVSVGKTLDSFSQNS